MWEIKIYRVGRVLSVLSGTRRYYQVTRLPAGDKVSVKVRTGVQGSDQETKGVMQSLSCPLPRWSSSVLTLHLHPLLLLRVRTASDCIMRMETKEVTQLRDVDSAFNQLLKPALASIKVCAEGVEVWNSGGGSLFLHPPSRLIHLP